MKPDPAPAPPKPETAKNWIQRLLAWLAKGHKKAVESGKYCPT